MTEEEIKRLIALSQLSGQSPYAAPGTSGYNGFNVAAGYSGGPTDLMQIAPRQSFGPPPTQQEMDALAFGGGSPAPNKEKMSGLFSFIKDKLDTSPGVTWSDGNIFGIGGNYAGRAGAQNPNIGLPNNAFGIQGNIGSIARQQMPMRFSGNLFGF
jgi:hypothetical protein